MASARTLSFPCRTPCGRRRGVWRPLPAAPLNGASAVAKKPNYDFEKRRKEMERKKKKDAKREERLQRKRDGVAEPDELAPPAADEDALPME